MAFADEILSKRKHAKIVFVAFVLADDMSFSTAYSVRALTMFRKSKF